MKVLFFCQDVTGAKVEQLTLALRLRWPDLKPTIASQGSAGLQALEQEEQDLVVLCEHLPDMSIWQAIEETRHFSDIPIVVAVDGGDETGVVKAIEAGADDYIQMPCNMMVVMARVAALMRRVGMDHQQAEEGPIHCGELVINPATYEAYMGSSRLPLTPKEFQLLHILAKNRRTVLSQEFIRRVIWPGEAEAGDALKKYVQRLRRKLGDNARNPTWITTIHGVGYRFSALTRAAGVPVPAGAG
jgi:DNA-binding response OmpR family regulator